MLKVYSAVFGGYDTLSPAKYPSVCFSDRDQAVPGWSATGVVGVLPPVSMNRWFKMHPHVVFPSAEYCLYHDGNIDLLVSPYSLIDKYLSKCDIAVFKHPERSTVEEELVACAAKHKARKLDLRRVRYFLEEQSFPLNSDMLSACWVILSRRCPRTALFFERWWELFSKLPAKRDQLTFDYVRWEMDLEVARLEGNLFKGTSSEFKRRRHVRS